MIDYLKSTKLIQNVNLLKFTHKRKQTRYRRKKHLKTSCLPFVANFDQFGTSLVYTLKH